MEDNLLECTVIHEETVKKIKQKNARRWLYI